MVLPEIGLYGQELLKKAKVLIVGAGGLGCPAAIYLAGAGVGKRIVYLASYSLRCLRADKEFTIK